MDKVTPCGQRAHKSDGKPFCVATFSAYRAATGAAERKRLASRLFAENAALVTRLVHKYAAGLAGEWDDHFQAGSLAFLHALDRFDPTRGKFSTYLGQWIGHFLQMETGARRWHRPVAVVEADDTIPCDAPSQHDVTTVRLEIARIEPARSREWVQRHFVEGHRQDEIAAEHGVSVFYVGAVIRRAMRKLEAA